jgi:hypothetical protein
VCLWRLSGVKWGIEPREEVAINDGRGPPLQVNDPLSEHAISDNVR